MESPPRCHRQVLRFLLPHGYTFAAEQAQEELPAQSGINSSCLTWDAGNILPAFGGTTGGCERLDLANRHGGCVSSRYTALQLRYFASGRGTVGGGMW